MSRDFIELYDDDGYRCGGTLCQSMALHNICNRIHSLLAGDGE